MSYIIFWFHLTVEIRPGQFFSWSNLLGGHQPDSAIEPKSIFILHWLVLYVDSTICWFVVPTRVGQGHEVTWDDVFF